MKEKSAKIELEPDAWQRFERAVKVVAKSRRSIGEEKIKTFRERFDESA